MSHAPGIFILTNVLLIYLLRMIELCLLGKKIVNSEFSDQTDCAVFASALLLFGTIISLQFSKYSLVLWPLFNCMIEFGNFKRASTKICSLD